MFSDNKNFLANVYPVLTFNYVQNFEFDIENFQEFKWVFAASTEI